MRWGIIGTGMIAKKFAADLAQSSHKVVAVGSRSKETADKFANEFNIPNRHATYEGLIADKDVEAIYVSLPNHMHKEWGIKCAAGRKHILLEKPLTVNRREADELLEAVKAHDVFLMEAFMYRTHPQTFKIRELLSSGAIGEVRMIHADFSYNMGPKYTNIRLSNPAAGGGIMDVGCYPVSFARMAAGCEPIECKAVAKIGPVSRVDEQATMVLRFPTGAVAALSCATQVSANYTATIFGSEGSIHVPVPWKPGNDAKIFLRRGGKEEEIPTRTNVPLYAVEADHVQEHIAKREAPAMTWADSIGNMNALDALRASVGLVFDGEC
ncbi:MAG TPA: Gfo/Idh/MocA family oxidoreductase [Planctomycetota bacterium]|nr:Gfo/Idh/MocA family oxidoreductase [Planctomycetota bacterium]